jgi:hypothetical protein
MKKKQVLFLVLIVTLVAIINLSTVGASDSIFMSSKEKGVVQKSRGESFKVEVAFQNTGKDEGTWSVNVVFEGESWSWEGTPKTLTLKKDATKTLSWKGGVPPNAAVGSVARLVVYYDDSFQALDWWISIVTTSELAIKSSNVS